MTEIIEILTTGQVGDIQIRRKGEKKQGVMIKLQQYYKKYSTYTFQQKESFFVFLETEFLCRKQLKDLKLSALLKITIQQPIFLGQITLLDVDGNCIKAKSQHQKTATSKYFNVLNTKANNLSIICNPITGQIKITIKFFMTSFQYFDDIGSTLMSILQQNKKIIQQALQFLQQIPGQINNLIQQISHKMQKCRVNILGQHKQYKQSQYHEEYQEYFIDKLPNQNIQYSWLDKTNTRILLEDLIEKLKNKYIQDPLKCRKSNYLYVDLVQNGRKIAMKKLDDLKNMINKDMKIQVTQFQQFTQIYQLKNNQTIQLDFKYKSIRKCDEQTKILQKISKANYCTFLREYVYLKNHEYLHKNYLVRKHEQLTKLNQFLSRNKLSLSYHSKLALCHELASIGYIALTTIKKINPSYQSYHLNINSDYSIKIDNVVCYYKNLIISAQIAQTCYQILFGIRCSSHCLKSVDDQIKITKWYHKIKCIDQGQAKYQGVSVITYWIKKVLTDVINNQFYQAHHINAHRKSINKNGYGYDNYWSNNKVMDVNRTENTLMGLKNQKLNGGSNGGNNYGINTCSDSYTLLMEKQLENKDRIEKMQKQELEKMLFVINMAYKSYSELFQYKIPTNFDIEV